MGMMSQLAARRANTQNGYQSGGTSSFPITGFPESAYTGNNRRSVGGGRNYAPTAMGGSPNVPGYNPQHMLLTAVGLVIIGVVLWHYDNK